MQVATGSDSGQGRLSGLLATGDAALPSPSQWPGPCPSPAQILRSAGGGSAIAAVNSGRPYSVAEHAAALFESQAAEGRKFSE
ncbi:hypothetical protein FIV00_03560 [Labrenzia sp. THAF82]|nr:hypothetical protein FIV00_03560 [Labrenzia sp. THAF82]